MKMSALCSQVEQFELLGDEKAVEVFVDPRAFVFTDVDVKSGLTPAYIQNPNVVDDLRLRRGKKRFGCAAHGQLHDFVRAQIVQELAGILPGAAQEAMRGQVEKGSFFEGPPIISEIVRVHPIH
jgi:hypothetical protein